MECILKVLITCFYCIYAVVGSVNNKTFSHFNKFHNKQNEIEFFLRAIQPLKMGSSFKSPNFKLLNPIWSTGVD